MLPGVAVLRRYDRVWLRGDVLGGITVAAYLVPQVLAYAEVAGLPAVTGLWAVGPGLLVYALLGSSRQLSVGPESTTALMTAAGVGALVTAAGGMALRQETAALLAIVVGLMCLVGFVLRLGFLSDLLSKPVLVGYMAGIAALMVVSQIGKVFGITVEGESFVQEVRYVLTHLGDTHLPTLFLSLGVLAVLFAFQRFAPTWPGPLIAMLGATVIVAVFDLVDRAGVHVVGPVPEGLPALTVPDIGRRGPVGAAARGARHRRRRLLRQRPDGPCLRCPAPRVRSTATRSSSRSAPPTSRPASSRASRSARAAAAP